jgi:hypothetical protein
LLRSTKTFVFQVFALSFECACLLRLRRRVLTVGFTADPAPARLDGVPQVARLHLQLHAQRPLMVVVPRQLRPVVAAVAFPDDALDDDFAWMPGVRAAWSPGATRGAAR